MRFKGFYILIILILVFQLNNLIVLNSFKNNNNIDKISCSSQMNQYDLDLFYNIELNLNRGNLNKIEEFEIRSRNNNILSSESFNIIDKSEFEITNSITYNEPIQLKYSIILFFFVKKEYTINLLISKKNDQCIAYKYSIL